MHGGRPALSSADIEEMLKPEDTSWGQRDQMRHTVYSFYEAFLTDDEPLSDATTADERSLYQLRKSYYAEILKLIQDQGDNKRLKKMSTADMEDVTKLTLRLIRQEKEPDDVSNYEEGVKLSKRLAERGYIGAAHVAKIILGIGIVALACITIAATCGAAAPLLALLGVIGVKVAAASIAINTLSGFALFAASGAIAVSKVRSTIDNVRRARRISDDLQFSTVGLTASSIFAIKKPAEDAFKKAEPEPLPALTPVNISV